MSKRLTHTKVELPVMKLTQAELDKITEVGLRVPRGDLLPGSRLKRHDPVTDTWIVMVYTTHPRPNDIESYTVEVVDAAVSLHQELETAVRDLYYSDGDLERAWVDGRSACAWLSQELDLLRNCNGLLMQLGLVTWHGTKMGAMVPGKWLRLIDNAMESAVLGGALPDVETDEDWKAAQAILATPSINWSRTCAICGKRCLPAPTDQPWFEYDLAAVHHECAKKVGSTAEAISRASIIMDETPRGPSEPE